jgi:Uma2 family endonuclease
MLPDRSGSRYCPHAGLPGQLPETDLMPMPAVVPRYTADEIRHFPDDRLRHEVIRGELFVTPAPGTHHQRAVLELAHRLHDYLQTHGLGEVLPAPFEVQFAEDSAVQPDVLVILESQRQRLSGERFYGPPALVIEVVSYSSKRTDRLQKRELYLAEGVAEYWVVDPEARHVERWRSGLTEPEVVTGRLSWQPTPAAGPPPFLLDLPALFAVVTR